MNNGQSAIRRTELVIPTTWSFHYFEACRGEIAYVFDNALTGLRVVSLIGSYIHRYHTLSDSVGTIGPFTITNTSADEIPEFGLGSLEHYIVRSYIELHHIGVDRIGCTSGCGDIGHHAHKDICFAGNICLIPAVELFDELVEFFSGVFILAIGEYT